jgi:hypothetical protein
MLVNNPPRPTISLPCLATLPTNSQTLMRKNNFSARCWGWGTNTALASFYADSGIKTATFFDNGKKLAIVCGDERMIFFAVGADSST